MIKLAPPYLSLRFSLPFLGKAFLFANLILLIILSFALFASNAFATSHSSGDQSSQLCLSKVTKPNQGALGKKINQHYHAFERGEGIYSTAEGQLEVIQSVIAESKYAWVLDCPRQIRERGYQFKYNFTKQGSWSFESKGSTRSTQIIMRRNNRFWPATSTYLHEMIHACQFVDERRTQVRNTLYKASSAKLKTRLRLIGEVEAFQAMHNLFSEAVEVSPLACEFRNNLDDLIWKGNLKTQARMEEGTFASGIIGWYVQNWHNFSYLDFVNISNFDSEKVQHAFFEEWVGWREFRPLNKEMADEILALGLKYDESKIPFLPDPFVSNLPKHFQSVLKMAKCYNGPFNDTWDQESANALEAFISAGNLPVKSNEPSIGLLRKVWNAAKGENVKCN